MKHNLYIRNSTEPIPKVKDTGKHMDALPPELVYDIVKRADALTLPVLRCVTSLWRDLVDLSQAQCKRPYKEGANRGENTNHVCTLSVRCAIRYAKKLAALSRWKLLEWMRDIAADDLNGLSKLHEHICAQAASGGDLRRLQHIAASGPLPTRACESAARYGHLHVLRWALESSRDAATTANVYVKAAIGGHLHVLQWAFDHEFEKSYWTCMHAARHGHFEVVKWAHQHGLVCADAAFKAAAQGGHLEIVQWLHSNDGSRDRHYSCVCSIAAEYGHLHVLEWACGQGYIMDSTTCSWAAGSGHLPILQWARARGCAWTNWTCRRAAEGGHLAVLQWARANGCPWDEETCSSAAAGGHLDVLVWARANGCPWDMVVCFAAAARNGHVTVLEWVRAAGHCAPNVSRQVVKRGRLNVLKWAAAANLFRLDESMYTIAARKDNLNILIWLRVSGCPMPERLDAFNGISAHPMVRKWLAQQYADQNSPL